MGPNKKWRFSTLLVLKKRRFSFLIIIYWTDFFKITRWGYILDRVLRSVIYILDRVLRSVIYILDRVLR